MSSERAPHRPLLDPLQMEEAGRTLRRMLDRLRRPHLLPALPAVDTSIDWEDGEPPEETEPPRGT